MEKTQNHRVYKLVLTGGKNAIRIFAGGKSIKARVRVVVAGDDDDACTISYQSQCMYIYSCDYTRAAE